MEKKVKIREGQAEINYQNRGEGSTTLLFLPGWCINGTYWEHQMSCFSENYRVCTLDLPGFGKSTAVRNTWTIEEYAKDVLAFIKTLDLKNVVLVGHSMCGDVMLEASLKSDRPIKGLIGVDNFKYIDIEFSQELMEMITTQLTGLKNDYKKTVPVFADQMLFHPSTTTQVRDKVKNDMLNTNPTIGYESMANLMQHALLVPSKLEQLNHLLYLINSDVVPTNQVGLKQRCKSGYNLKEIPETGHYPMIEKPEEFNQLLAAVLKEIS